MPLLARISRIVPLVIALAVIAGVVYVVAMFLYSPTRAKEILIKLFTFLMSILSAFFALASVYALVDGNFDVFELAASFLATTLIGFGVTLLCRRTFLKHNPNYRKKPEKTSGFKWFRFKK